MADMKKEPLNNQLLDILVCPEDKGKLWYFQDEEILYNPRLKRKYEITDGIPIMLVEKSQEAGAEEHKRLKDLATTLGLE